MILVTWEFWKLYFGEVSELWKKTWVEKLYVIFTYLHECQCILKVRNLNYETYWKPYSRKIVWIEWKIAQFANYYIQNQFKKCVTLLTLAAAKYLLFFYVSIHWPIDLHKLFHFVFFAPNSFHDNSKYYWFW